MYNERQQLPGFDPELCDVKAGERQCSNKATVEFEHNGRLVKVCKDCSENVLHGAYGPGYNLIDKSGSVVKEVQNV